MIHQDGVSSKTTAVDVVSDKIEEDKIILSESGKFPKKVIIVGKGKPCEYRLIKTQAGKYHLNK